jgi:hypothetical protein
MCNMHMYYCVQSVNVVQQEYEYGRMYEPVSVIFCSMSGSR